MEKNRFFLFFLVFSPQVLSLEIVESSAAEILVKEGDPVELFCESSDRYLWCQWLKVDEEKEFLTTSTKEEEEVVEEGEEGFEWVKSRTKCGLRFEAAERSLAGQWKCQLSNTNEDEGIKDERMFQMGVGWEAHHQLVVSGPQAFKLDSEASEDMEAVEGKEVVMECGVEEEGNPPPELTLTVETEEGEVILQAESCEGVEEEEECEDRSVKLVMEAELEHEGAVVKCVSRQVGLEDEVMFESEVSQGGLEVHVAPSIIWESSTFVEYEGVELILQAKFRAKPAPEEGGVRWFAVFPSNDTHLELHPDMQLENADIILEPVTEVEEEDHTFLSLLHVSHVISNLSIEFQIHNSVGKISGIYQVFIPPPPPTVPIFIEEDEESENENVEESEDIKDYEDYEEKTSGSGDDESEFNLETEEIVTEDYGRDDNVTEGAAFFDEQVQEEEVTAASMSVGTILAVIFGVLFGLLLIFLGLFLCQAQPRRTGNPSEIGSTNHLARVRSKDMSSPSNLSPLMVGDSNSLPEDYTFPGPPMTTFGKSNGAGPRSDSQVANGKLPPPPADILVVRLDPDEGDHHGVDDLDNLSDLGVGREDADPLASWEDLEPGLDARRSRNLDDLEIESSLFTQTPRSSTVMLSGPTGYPVAVPTSPTRTTLSPNPRLTPALTPHPPPSPRGSSLQLLHLHTPTPQ